MLERRKRSEKFRIRLAPCFGFSGPAIFRNCKHVDGSARSMIVRRGFGR
jgi:hypothetical protein